MKHILTLILLLALPLTAAAQSAESDSLYAAGVELYRQGQYREALPLFERVSQLDHEQLPETSARPEYGDAWAAACWHHLGNDVKARKLATYNYELEPLDRRLTVRMDSIGDAAYRSFLAQDLTAAQEQVKAAIGEAESIFGNGHYAVFGLLEAAAYISMMAEQEQQFHVMVQVLNAIAESHYSESNPARMLAGYITVDYLMFKQEFDAAESLASAAIAAMEEQGTTWTEMYARLCSTHANSLYMLGRVDDFVTAHAKTRKVGEAVFGRDSEQYANMLRTSIPMLKQIGNEQCIDQAEELVKIVEHLNGRKSEEYVAECLTVASTAIPFKEYRTARRYASAAYDVASECYPDSTIMVLGSKIMYLGAYILQSQHKGRLNELVQLRDEIGQRLGTDHALYLTARSIEMAADVLADPSSYEQHIDEYSAIYQQLRQQSSSSGFDAQTLRTDIALAYSLCTSGHSDRGRELGLAAIDSLRTVLADPSTGWLAHSIMPELTNIAQLCERYSWNGAADSLKYTFKLLQRECLRLQLEQEVRLDSAGSSRFMWNLFEFRSTLIYTHDTLSTRATIEQMAEAVRQKCGEQSDEYSRCLDELSSCYAADSPELIPLLERRVAICEAVDQQHHFGYESYKTRQARTALYHARGDNAALLSMMLEERERNRTSTDATSLINLCIETGQYDRATALAKAEFQKQLQESKRQLRRKKSNQSYEFTMTGYAARAVLDTYIKAGRTDSVPTVCAELTARLHDELPQEWAYIMHYLLSFREPAGHEGLLQQTIDRCNSQLDYFRNNSSLQAMLISKDDWNAYTPYMEYDAATARLDSAMALVATDNPRMCDELLLYKYGKEYDRYYDNDDEHLNAYLLGLFAQRVIELFEKYDDRNRYSEYALALTMQAKALTARIGSDPELAPQLRQCCELLRQCLTAEQQSFTTTGQTGLYAGYVPNPFGFTPQLKPINQLLAAAEALADEEAIAQVGSMVVQHQMADMQKTILYGGRSYVQEQLDDFVATATRVAAITRRDSLAAMAYDASIYCKGALLRSDQLVEQQVLTSRNQTAIELYRELQHTRQLMDEVRQNGLDADSLQLRASTLGDRMMDYARSFGDYTRALTASWQDIRRQLRTDDAAIEFTSYTHHDTVYYCALVLRHDSATPQLIPLCTEAQLATATDVRQLANAYTYVWAPMADALRGMSNIYFSPSGLLHQIPVEYAPTPQGLLSDSYHMYRLSNTRELLLSHQRTQQPKSLLIGGVVYDPDMESWASATREYASQNDAPLLAMRDFDVTRYASMGFYLAYLEGTEREVGDIESMMRQADMQVTSLTGVNATEDAFKAMSGSDVSIMHIATHGFYVSATEQANTSPLLADAAQGSEEDRAMSRSGLMLAGAETFLMDYDMPEGANDGVLTARELARMDLTRTELVVLSACESGLGDITGDGVFGLQRGFKKAGAGCLLMSLWKVDDEATCYLMTEFYRQLLAGQGKQQALDHAKNAVKAQTARGWDDPTYWAAFIMLDGLERQ